MEEFFYYWKVVGSDKLFRIFWHFFIFEFTRYLLLDYLILGMHAIKRWRERHILEEARRELHLRQPLVSIIAPGKNEGGNYYNLVRSLNEQTYRNYEIILVDDGSDDDSKIIGRDMEKHGLVDLFISNDFRGGKASAANLALKYARGDYIVHIDADCSFDSDAIENIVIPFFVDEKIGAVAGNVGVRNADAGMAPTLQSIEYACSITVGRMVSSYLALLRIVSGAFGAFRKDITDRIGGWDIGPGLDGDITVKIRKMGYTIAFEPNALCLTNVPVKFSILAKQRQRWNKSLIRFRLRKHANLFFPDSAFTFRNSLSALDNIFYNLILDVTWVIYLADMAVNHSDMLLTFILPCNYLIYTASTFMQYMVYLMMAEDRSEKWKLLWYVPLCTLYTGFFLRIVRTIAYIKEFFFFSSYKDPWNPEKSSKFARKMGI